MKMNWYYRLMLSYTPIFFVVISSIIFIFFLMLNRDAENKYMLTNESILERMVHNTDVNLMLIERNVVSQLLMDRTVQSFFSGDPKSVFEFYEIQNKLVELKSTFPFQNAIYMYNESDGRIISESGSYSLGTFWDKDFLLSNYTLEAPNGWNAPRLFAQLAIDDNKQKVVSLVKFYSNGDTRLGAVVVNVYVSYIMDYLNSFNKSDIHIIQLEDTSFEGLNITRESSSILVNSKYTGWQYVAEGLVEQSYSTLSLFSSAWMIIVIIIIILALVGFTLVTHMHYKPIQSIMEKVGHFSTRKSEELRIKNAKNEFTFIETALDHLLKKSLDYENLYKEDSLLRQQQLFHELLLGHQMLSDKEFKDQLKSWGLSHPYDRLGVIVVEIDNYSSFTAKYVLRDQNLLKFILVNAFQDLGQQNSIFVWHAWMTPHRIAYVAHLHNSEKNNMNTIMELVKEFQKWIQVNLELTVTIGIGAYSKSIASIAESYHNAQDNADLKTIFGTNTIIDNQRSAGKLSVDSYAYRQALRSAANSFRMNESDWREKLTLIIKQLKEMRFVKSEMTVFINSFVVQMDKVIATLSSEVQGIWKNDYRHLIEDLSEKVESLDVLEEQLMVTLSDFEAVVDHDRQARRHHSLALQAKSYIDANYTNPDFSLTLVCEYLKMQPSALSQIFKEELGEKFIDYVLKIRLEHAKRLLEETNDSIQSIAEQIGYQNVISFYRVFRKAHDVPPGEYRNQYHLSQNS